MHTLLEVQYLSKKFHQIQRVFSGLRTQNYFLKVFCQFGSKIQWQYFGTKTGSLTQCALETKHYEAKHFAKTCHKDNWLTMELNLIFHENGLYF